MKYIINEDDEYSYPMHMQASCSTLPVEEESDVIAQLHAVVAEITGKPVPNTEKPRMGFLP